MTKSRTGIELGVVAASSPWRSVNLSSQLHSSFPIAPHFPQLLSFVELIILYLSQDTKYPSVVPLQTISFSFCSKGIHCFRINSLERYLKSFINELLFIHPPLTPPTTTHTLSFLVSGIFFVLFYKHIGLVLSSFPSFQVCIHAVEGAFCPFSVIHGTPSSWRILSFGDAPWLSQPCPGCSFMYPMVPFATAKFTLRHFHYSILCIL